MEKNPEWPCLYINCDNTITYIQDKEEWELDPDLNMHNNPTTEYLIDTGGYTFKQRSKIETDLIWTGKKISVDNLVDILLIHSELEKIELHRTEVVLRSMQLVSLVHLIKDITH